MDLNFSRKGGVIVATYRAKFVIIDDFNGSPDWYDSSATQ